MDTLLDLLSVLVEFWCQQYFKLNQNLVEKSLKDLAEHFAVISQGMENGKKNLFSAPPNVLLWYVLCVNVSLSLYFVCIFYVCVNHKKTNTVEVQCYFSAVATLRNTAAGKNMQ